MHMLSRRFQFDFNRATMNNLEFLALAIAKARFLNYFLALKNVKWIEEGSILY